MTTERVKADDAQDTATVVEELVKPPAPLSPEPPANRPRKSTLVIAGCFALVLALYLWVRPEPQPPTVGVDFRVPDGFELTPAPTTSSTEAPTTTEVPAEETTTTTEASTTTTTVDASTSTTQTTTSTTERPTTTSSGPTSTVTTGTATTAGPTTTTEPTSTTSAG
jgi:hypothetical protein